ncbi:MAG: magnesium transporter CorA family protein [Bacilli bacterium]|nr:magnesium transporter CorA family protein [Bacilli bacterium]
MLRVYKTDQVTKHVKKLKKIQVDSWIALTNPTNDEINKVVERTKVDVDLIRKMLDTEELPRVEQSDNGTLIVIDTPYLEEDTHKYTTYPIGIIITNNNFVITVSPKKNSILDDFKNNKVSDFRTAKKTRFLIQILLKTSSYYLKALKEVSQDIDAKEEVLKKSTKNKDLIDLLNIEKTLVYFISSLKANELVLEKLYRGIVVTLYEDDKDYLEDAVIENKQAIEMSTIYKSILKSISNTYETIASNNLNDAMKFLAGITIVLSIPTMISSFLGMNIPLGNIMTDTLGFLKIICVSFIISLVLAYVLRKKNML